MEEFDSKAAREQIARGPPTVLVPRLSQEEIDALTRPRKRQAKKKYHFLSFDLSDDEDDFLEILPPPEKKKRKNSNKASKPTTIKKQNDAQPSIVSRNEKNYSRKRKGYSDVALRKEKSSLNNISRKNSFDENRCKNSTCKPSFDDLQTDAAQNDAKPVSLNDLKPIITTEVKVLKIPKEEPTTYTIPPRVAELDPSDTKHQSDNIIKKSAVWSTNTNSASNSAQNSKIGKIRIKSAAELGSTVIFIDDDIPPLRILPAMELNTSRAPRSRNSPVNNVNVARNENNPSQVRNSNIEVQLIVDLYTKLFTAKNQNKIRNVAEILQSIAENIKNNNERIQEITKNKDLTEAEKLMRRCLSFQDLKRKQEENEQKLKEKFESIITIFDHNNFELYFQLFFLGILKMLIVSVSYFYKKGTIFKKLITLLQQSLTNSKFNDERVFKLLKAPDFRDKCITLVQFIEKYCKTESFSMLFLSTADKNLIKNKSAHSNELPVNEDMRRKVSSQKYAKPEVSSVQERESFLLNLLKESKAIDSVPASSNNHQQQQKWKTYAPALKRNTSEQTTNSVPVPKNTSKSNTANSNKEMVNSFIFSDGQIKPYPNNVINIQTTEPNVSVRLNRPSQNDTNHYLNRPVSSSNPANTTYHVNPSPYNTHNKLHHVNGLNGTHLFSTSNGNIENIQPDSFVNTNNNAKKVTKDNTWNNGLVNPGGLRSLLVNEPPVDTNRPSYQRYVEYAPSNLNLNPVSRGPPVISMPKNTNNTWMG